MCQEERTQQKGKLSRMSMKSNLNKKSAPVHDSWGLAAATALGPLRSAILCRPWELHTAGLGRGGRNQKGKKGEEGRGQVKGQVGEIQGSLGDRLPGNGGA